MTNDPLHIISLGAGVQSTTMTLMALHGELTPRPAAAIFADTGWEPASVYAHLAWLEGVLTEHRVPLYRVSGGDLRADALAYAAGNLRGGWRLPLFVRGRDGEAGMLGRQCTRNYKIRPIQRQVKALLREHGVSSAVQWIGISLDEATRMKPSDYAPITNRWPLVERRMTRADCLLWLERHGYAQPPKSACIGCPLHGDAEWRAIRSDPAAWTDAIAVDESIRSLPGKNGINAYLHRSLMPLPMVDLRTRAERGQLSLWDQECTGMCGV